MVESPTGSFSRDTLNGEDALRRKLFIHFVLLIVEGIACLFWLLIITADPNSPWIFGYSRSRFILAALMLIYIAFLFWFAIQLWRNESHSRKITQLVENILKNDDIFAWGLILSFLGVVAGSAVLLIANFTLIQFAEAYVSRLSPLAFCFILGLAHVFLMFILSKKIKGPEIGIGFRNQLWNFFPFLIIALAIWVPRALELDLYVTADETKWERRSADFYYALNHRDYEETFRREHPGVTVMWAGTIGFLVRFPEYVNVIEGTEAPEKYELFLVTNGFKTTDLLVTSRMIMTIANTIILLMAFAICRHLIGTDASFLGFLIIAFDPFHISHSRLLHLDGLLSNLMLLSLLGFFDYLTRRERVSLLISGIAAGFSWLTKSPGIALIPILGIIGFFGSITFFRENLGSQKVTYWNTRTIKKQSAHILQFVILPIGIWFLIGFFIFTIFWPAMWVDPLNTLSRVFSLASEYAVEGHDTPIFFNGMIFSDGKVGAGSFFYPIVYLWRVTPLVLGGVILAITGLVFRFSPFSRPGIRHFTLSILIFVLLFGLMLSVGMKKADRYLLPVFPPLDLIAALGWLTFGNSILTKQTSLHKHMQSRFVIGILFFVQLLGFSKTFPYTLSYYNSIMGGIQGATDVMMIGWGEGLNEAGRYLSSKPNPEALSVFSWYARGSFSYYFSGDSESIDAIIDRDQFNEILAADYAVIYFHQWQRQTPKQLLEFLADKQPEHSIWIDGLEYVRIYNLQENK